MSQADINVLLAVLTIAPASMVFAWWRVARRLLRRRELPPVRLIAASRVSHFEVGVQIDDIVNQIGLKAFVDSLIADESRSSFGPLLQALDLSGPTREAAVNALTLLLPLVTRVNLDTLRPPERSAFYNISTRHDSDNRYGSTLIIAAVNAMVRMHDFQAIPYLQQMAEREPVESHTEKVRISVREAITQLLAIKQAEHASATLLRPTSPRMNPLLRPASAADSAQDMLLRALTRANDDSDGCN